MKLKVRARGTAMVPHYESLGRQKRFIGRVFDPKAGPDGGWPAHDQVEEVPTVPTTHDGYHEIWMEYRRDVREGALWAADEDTARECGVKFDPSFGGEHDWSASEVA